MQEFSELTNSALRKWLSLDWHTTHPNDMERFFIFVESLYHDIESTYGEEDLDSEELKSRMREVLEETGARVIPATTEEKLGRSISKIELIFDFLESCRKRRGGEA